MPEFDGEANVVRQERQECLQRLPLNRRKIRPALHQDGTKPRAQLACAIHKQLERRRGVDEPSFVCDLLRQLEGEDEV